MSSRRIEIFCPKCKWEPSPPDQWQCSCSHLWNTFDTGGTCPECGAEWQQTQCLSCDKYSLHSNWYHEFIPDEAVEKEQVIEEVS